jgi:tRNA threonylcarbamoyladenosine biosynthesis protein TsaE
MAKMIITDNFKETQKLGEKLAKDILAGKITSKIICLSGDLGAGKTTFTQGLLKGLKVAGPYTSPTFVIMKKYSENIFHLDAYRVGADDILNLGWEELIVDPQNIIIVEWADRIEKIIPLEAVRINFEWVDESKRKITFQ